MRFFGGIKKLLGSYHYIIFFYQFRNKVGQNVNFLKCTFFIFAEEFVLKPEAAQKREV